MSRRTFPYSLAQLVFIMRRAHIKVSTRPRLYSSASRAKRFAHLFLFVFCFACTSASERNATRRNAGAQPAETTAERNTVNSTSSANISSLAHAPTAEAAERNRRTDNKQAHGWTTLDGERIALDKYLSEQNIVVLDFYATWCAPCRAQTPHLVRLHKEYASRGLRIVGLNVGGEEDLAEIPKYMSEFRITYQLATPDKELADYYLWDNTAIPQTFVLDRRGQLIKRFVGDQPDLPVQLDQIIRTELEKSESAKSKG